MDIQYYIRSNNLQTKETARTLTIYTPDNRVSIAKDIANNVNNAIYYPTPTTTSSIGHIKIDKLTVYIKPSKGNVTKHQYSLNEQMLADKVNQLTKPTDIHLRSSDHQIIIENVVRAAVVGNDTTNNQKTDVRLFKQDGTHFNISLKMENAACWQSADSMFAPAARPIIEQAIANNVVDLHKTEFVGIYRISPKVIIPATYDEMVKVIFGSDILGQGCVLTKTFSDESFIYDRLTNGLYVKCQRLIETPKHVNIDTDVCFVVRNDKTRGDHIIPGVRGLRIIAQMDPGKLNGVWLNR